MPTLDGTIAIAGLPPHRGLIVSLCFYRVEVADAPAPHLHSLLDSVCPSPEVIT